MKINDKVRILRKNESNQWTETGKGVVKAIYINRMGEDVYVLFTDRDWSNQEITERIPINAECMKVVKF